MENKDQNFLYTYNKNRRCQNPECNKKIPDQAHGLIKFCPREVMPDGSIKSCKDDFHSKKNKAENANYRGLIKHQRQMNKSITNLLKKNGEAVIIQDLNNYGIILKKAIQIEKKNDGKYIFYYSGYIIDQIDNNNFKIQKHDKLL